MRLLIVCIVHRWKNFLHEACVKEEYVREYAELLVKSLYA